MNVLVAGGAGYIGSHTIKRLKEAGHSPVIYDNVSRGHKQVIDILKVPGVVADLGDKIRLVETLRKYKIDTVMHFAAYAYVGESVERPLMYYHNNVGVTIGVLEAMKEAGVERFVFSSSCATYGNPDRLPITEDEKKAPVSPYGRSKLMVEQILADAMLGNKNFKFAALRYFNASGCAMDGSLGEDHDPETHLIPVILQAIMGLRRGITVFGTDYPTPDGTNIRDYIHVEDLCAAHIAAMEAQRPGDARFYNLGIGRGYSVREVLDAARRVTGLEIPVEYGLRRPGDPAVLYADASKIRRELCWSAQYTEIDPIVATAWAWFKNHPHGYK